MTILQFSRKEEEVINCLLEGKSNKQIAFELGIPLRTGEAMSQDEITTLKELANFIYNRITQNSNQ